VEVLGFLGMHFLCFFLLGLWYIRRNIRSTMTETSIYVYIYNERDKTKKSREGVFMNRENEIDI